MLQRRVLLPLIVILTAVAPGTAQNSELVAAKQKIQVLLSQAEELMQKGRVNQAERVLNQAKEMKAKVARAESRLRAGGGSERRRGSDDYYGLFDHLEQAVAALRKLGRGEQAEQLSAHARELRQSFRRQDRERHANREAGEHRERGERGEERERLQWELNVFRFAKGMYSELEKEKLVELVERSMHARELKLAGRRDREARELEQAQPSVGNEVELLNYAAKLYAKRGAEEKAAALAKLGKQLATQAKRIAERERGREHDRLKLEGEEETEEEEEVEEVREERADPRMADRLERLRRQVAELERVLKELQQNAAKGKRRRDR